MKAGCLFLLALLSGSIFADDNIVLSDDGREVRLNADGSWEYLSEDRFATTESGTRIRLREDGQWEVVDQQSAGPASTFPATGSSEPGPADC